MATNRTNIGSKFQNTDIPSEADFKEIFDSFVHKDEDKADFQMVERGTDTDHYVTPALLRTGLQNIGIITGNCYMPHKENFEDSFSGTILPLTYFPIPNSVKVFKNGQLLQEGPDYTVNYDTAQIKFLDPVSDRNLEVDYWYKNLDPTPDSSGNYVDLTTDQTIAGNKTFDSIVLDAQKTIGSPFYFEDFATGFGGFINSENRDAPWQWVSDGGVNGSTGCLSAGAIGNLSNSAVELSISTTQESTLLKYWCKTSTEINFDYLHVEVNGVIVKRYSGENDWKEDHVFIHGIGPQLIRFIYNKDLLFVDLQDKVWIDKVSLTNISEDLIVYSDALFTSNATFKEGIVGKGLSSFKDIYITRSLGVFDAEGNETSKIESYQGGGVFAQYAKDSTIPLTWMQVNDNLTQLYVKNTDGSDLFDARSDVNFPNGFIQVNNPEARVIIGSDATNYTDSTFAVYGNTKLDGSLDTTNTVTADQFTKRDGLSSEFLKADGSVDATAYLPLTGGTISGNLVSNTFVKTDGTSDDILLADGSTTSLSALGGDSSPLAVLDEGNGNGYRLANADPLNFGNIGADAVDFSYSDTPSDVFGATGESSFAVGYNVIAGNYNSTAFGALIDNNGIGSFDAGFNLKDRGYTNSLFGVGHDVTSINTTVVGQGANTITDQILDYNATADKKLFVVGNGIIQNADDSYTVNTRSDALVVRLNGSVEAPSLTNAKIDADTTGKIVATKEWVQTQRPYKVYTALLSQTGTSAPTATVLENTLGGTVSFTYFGAGAYYVNSSSLFTVNKTGVIISSLGVSSSSYNITAIPSTLIITTSVSGVYTDGYLSNTFFEIRVYN